MANFICITCGVQYPESDAEPGRCAICDEERQFIGMRGQLWTTLPDMREKNLHTNEITEVEPGLWMIITRPHFAIGQRAFLVQTPEGNLLWDCITYLDEATIARVNELGGVKAIALSHPHYYSTIVEWSDAFGGAPVYIHKDDGQWVQRTSDNVKLWEGVSMPLFGGITLVNPRGHFDGGAVAVWPAGAEGKGVLLAGDIIQVIMQKGWVSFMYSYPNLIPLSAKKVQYIVDTTLQFPFERIWGAFEHRQVMEDGHGSVRRSAERYIKYLNL